MLLDRDMVSTVAPSWDNTNARSAGATARPPPLPLFQSAHENINENIDDWDLGHPDSAMTITKEAERMCAEQVHVWPYAT